MENVIVYGTETGIAMQIKEACVENKMGLFVANSSEKLLAYLSIQGASVVLLDVTGTVQRESLKLLSMIRERSRLPIIVVVQKGLEFLQIPAFSAGADDFVNTDCHLPELMARIRCQLTRYMQLSKMCNDITKIYKVDGLVLDDSSRKVTVDGREVKLTPIEYKILRLLVIEKGKVFSISEIYEDIWNLRAVGADNIIAVHIRHIREKIELDPKKPRYLKVVWGTGYKVG